MGCFRKSADLLIEARKIIVQREDYGKKEVKAHWVSLIHTHTHMHTHKKLHMNNDYTSKISLPNLSRSMVVGSFNAWIPTKWNSEHTNLTGIQFNRNAVTKYKAIWSSSQSLNKIEHTSTYLNQWSPWVAIKNNYVKWSVEHHICKYNSTMKRIWRRK